MGYRPFGPYRDGVSESMPTYPVGDQWPEPPEAVREAVDGKLTMQDYNRFERWVYRWLARPRFWPRRRRRSR